jgi:hypothetical protein
VALSREWTVEGTSGIEQWEVVVNGLVPVVQAEAVEPVVLGGSGSTYLP